jgi:dienelactone hydrolase
MRQKSTNIFRRRNVHFFLLSIFILVPAFPQAGQTLPRGKIIDNVPCRGDPSQTYALYLPSGYAADKQWPILYALDAGARGNLPVERFKEAAEKYGYIVVGSNNSRNGPVKIVQDAVNALLIDTNTRLSVDRRRVYIAGFSGGSRAAIQVGLAMKGKVAGILAFGAGFPPDIPPTAAIPFAMYLAAGDEDFNFSELRTLDGTLKDLEIPHFFESFSGGHEWPPKVVCTHSLEWLELQAMKSGSRAKDPFLINGIYTESIAEAASLEKAGQVRASFARYSALAGFRELTDVTELEAKITQLSMSAELRKSRSDEKEIETRERAVDRELTRDYEDLVSRRDPQFAAQRLNAELNRLRSEANQKTRETARLAAARSLSRFWITLNEETAAALERYEYNAAALRMELMSVIRPDNPRIKFNLACVYSVGGRKKEAIQSLEKAVAKGFKDVATIESIRDLDPLRNMPEYRKIIEDIKKQ